MNSEQEKVKIIPSLWLNYWSEIFKTRPCSLWKIANGDLPGEFPMLSPEGNTCMYKAKLLVDDGCVSQKIFHGEVKL